MSRNQKILFFLTAWAILLMPFLFWWNTWFGRPLSNQQLNEYLHDHKKPRHIQHALVQMGERMSRQDPSVKQWYPELLQLASDPVEEVRNTDAWVMGQDTSGAGFHDALLKMLNDLAPTVRGNAALSLVRFGDASGHAQIVSLLQPARLTAPASGKIADADRPGTAIREGGLIAKLQAGTQVTEIRSPIAGRIQSVTAPGATLAEGAEVAVVNPSSEQIWEALRALYVIGQSDDLDSIRRYERDVPEISNDLRQQALATERAIRERASR